MDQQLSNALSFGTILQACARMEALNMLQELTPHIPDDVVEAEFLRVHDGVGAPDFEEGDYKHRSWYFGVLGIHVQGSLWTGNLSWSEKAGFELRCQYPSNVLVSDGTSPKSYRDEAHALVERITGPFPTDLNETRQLHDAGQATEIARWAKDEEKRADNAAWDIY